MKRPLQDCVRLGILGALLAGSLAGQQAPSEETIRFFKTNCYSCHTIGGGRLTGPDLKDVEARQERAWLVRFMLDPKGVIDSGDPYARQIFQEARGVYMTAVPGMTPELANKLLDLVASESLLEKSQFAGLVLSDRPLTEEDVAAGRALFEGRQRLLSGAPPCFSCHTLGGARLLGGGNLGPDLTTVYARMEGRKALAAWLSAPPTPVMQPVFERQPLDGEEILALVAYLKDAAEHGEEVTVGASLEFLLAGFGVAALILALFDLAWRNRFRAVRRPLVEENTL